MERKNKVLVIGGTGYLGQHLLQRLSQIKDTPFDLAFTHYSTSTPPQPLLDAIPHSLAFHVDLQSGEGFQAISRQFGQVRIPITTKFLYFYSFLY